ncbi:hypothetical protein XENOCAPTIV_018695 [Xenoophorus captivus]|uniref:Uncharacterized protein n=1 Tax=Xenoophorus captivus TaxID=1517983 RepID=A0ABV0S2R2_9TELE
MLIVGSMCISGHGTKKPNMKGTNEVGLSAPVGGRKTHIILPVPSVGDCVGCCACFLCTPTVDVHAAGCVPWAKAGGAGVTVLGLGRTNCQAANLAVCADGLPLPKPLADREAGNHPVDLRPPFTHVVLNVKDKRLLAEVGVYNLSGCLKPHGGIQVGLEEFQTIVGGINPNNLKNQIEINKTLKCIRMLPCFNSILGVYHQPQDMAQKLLQSEIFSGSTETCVQMRSPS